jgi:hypothetical protein
MRVFRRFLTRLKNFASRRKAIDGCGKRSKSILRLRRRKIFAPVGHRQRRVAWPY